MEVQYFENGDLAVFNGLKYRRDKKTGYYLNSTTHQRLHRAYGNTTMEKFRPVFMFIILTAINRTTKL
jgi:hypothetical protein